MEHTLTFTDKSRTTRPRNAGAAPHTTEVTHTACSCGASFTTIFSPPLLRRIESKGETREQYMTRTFCHNA